MDPSNVLLQISNLFFSHFFFFRYDKSEGMLKELKAAHISLTQQAEGLRKTNEGLKLQQERSVFERAD